ncbi:MAG: tetratricopeptide repeat protein [Candidatus Aminicenantes bacterium]|nr:tetratricopeptide repeat protein [Candidatus Aminicenantes bacterium]
MAKKAFLILLVPALIFLSSGTLWGWADTTVHWWDWHWFEPAARKNQKGIQAYEQGRYSEALQDFLSAKGVKPDSPELKNNTASALYELKKYKEAVDEFSRLDPGRLRLGKADFYYNLGNSYYRLGQFPQALENYKRSLRQNPDDVDCKKNFELTLKKIEEQKQKQQQNQQQPQQQPQDQKNPQPQEQEQQQAKQKYNAMMQFLNQNEKQQLEKKKRKHGATKNEKDW